MRLRRHKLNTGLPVLYHRTRQYTMKWLRGATRLRTDLLKLMGRITSKITNDPRVWSLYSKLYLMTDSSEDKEKGLNFLMKAYRLTSQASNWESDVERFSEVIDMTLYISEVSTEVSKSKASSQQAIQVLSSAKLIMKQLIVKAEKHHTDSVTGELASDIADNINKLKGELVKKVEEIEHCRLSLS
ncbi:Tetratricopeptide repeat protein 27 [Exaiptasia diaphana]|nr:Tetratricopeptide repeat protein 27 [Exaiptasia diaphana]